MVFISKNNKWHVKDWIFRSNSVYKTSLEKYLNCISPLFEKAQQSDEFDFICTLLRVRGMQDAGWDPWENTLNAFHKLLKLENKIRDFETKRHLFLWLYGHIVEASEPYETIANIINIIEGGKYSIDNFPDKAGGRPQSPSEKIASLNKRLESIGLARSTVIFNDVFDKELRNSIFHSDYSLYQSEVRLPGKYGKIYTHDQILALMNKALT